MPIVIVSLSEQSLVSLAEMCMQLGDVDKTLVSNIFVISLLFEYIFADTWFSICGKIQMYTMPVLLLIGILENVKCYAKGRHQYV